MIDNKKQAELLCTEYTNLYQEKNTKRENMKIAAQFFEPDDETLSGQKVIARATNEDEDRILLDTTVLKVVKDYVTSVLGLSFFQSSRWFRIEHSKVEVGSEDQKVLNKRAEIVYKQIKRSNYYSQIVPLEFDVVGYGHGLFVIDEDDRNFARCYAKNPYGVILLSDVYGEVYKAMWEQQYDLKSLMDTFPSLVTMYEAIEKQDSLRNQNFSVLCAFFELHEANGLTEMDKEKKANGYRYVMKYVLKEGKKFGYPEDTMYIEESQYFKSKSVLPCRDMVTRSNAYGKGVFRDLIPKARILNALSYGELEMIAQQYNPPLLMDSDIYEVVGKKKVSAGARFIKRVKNALGLDSSRKAVERLDVIGDLNAVHTIRQSHQSEVADTLPTAANIYKVSRQSVEEIQQRMSDEEKKLAPLRSTYAKEAVSEHIRRFYALCEKNGYFDGLDISDKSINIKHDSKDLIFDGFLLQKYRQGVVRRILQALNSASILAPSQPQAFAYLNGDRILKTLFDNLEVFDMLKSDEQVKVERERTVELAERQQQATEQQAATEGISGMAKMAGVLQGGE